MATVGAVQNRNAATMIRDRFLQWFACALAVLLVVCAPGPQAHAKEGLPAQIAGEPIRRSFDGQTDDLLSAGLGAEGLRGPPPGFANPLAPTALELRRRAIWTNYRGLADLTDGGGFGRLSGPRAGERIAGVEYLAAVRKPGGAGATTVMLQIPAHFDPARPCLVAVASSGSRGIYGALPTAGEWGLRKGCAVVHSDKGTGTGFVDLDTGTAYRIDLVATADAGDPLVTWRPRESAALTEWQRANPHRVAIRHVHDGENSQSAWGLYLLQAVKAGFELLAREFPAVDGRAAVTRERTLVIGSGISNGGGAVLRAAEADRENLLDGVVVSEPNVSVGPGRRVAIRMGGQALVTDAPPALFDHVLLHYLLQPAAVLAPGQPTPMTAVPETLRSGLEAWTARLAERGLLAGDTPLARARDARRQLEAAGVLREALDGGIANVSFGVWPALAEGYASAHAKLGLDGSACGLSYAPVDAAFQARAFTAEERARLAADSTGIPPTAGIQIVDRSGRFASFGSMEHLLCVEEFARSPALRAGVLAAAAAARTGETPVIVLHGRRDALIPVNFSSRAWYARNRQQGGRSAHYYEVEHGHHFDAFNALPGWGERFVPMQPQLLAAMDLMHAHLVAGRELPPSQVVRSHTRRLIDGQPEPVTPDHLGRIVSNPAADTIRFRRGTLLIPE
ncbi:MAG TPA: 3-hydroxybutyrate oligomer hydrolase family protein [Steroidobacteraceae bacterium]